MRERERKKVCIREIIGTHEVEEALVMLVVHLHRHPAQRVIHVAGHAAAIVISERYPTERRCACGVRSVEC